MNVALTQEIPDLTGIVVGVRWAAGQEPRLTDNLVVAAILCDSAHKALSDDHFVFFNQLTTPDESVSQLEAVLGDDAEQIEIDLDRVPPEVARIVIVLYLNEGLAQRRSLNQLRECVIRVLNQKGHTELVRSENLVPLHTTLATVLGEVYRHGGHWKFKVIGEAYGNGIAGVAADYGVRL